MTTLLKFGITAALLVSVSGCTAWVLESAQTSADEANELANCAEQNDPGSAAARMARIRANEARSAAQRTLNVDNSAARNAKAEADRKAQEARAAEAEAKTAEDEAAAAEVGLAEARRKVAAAQAYRAAKQEYADAQAEKNQAYQTAMSSRNEDDRIAYEAALKRWSTADAGFASQNVQYAAAFPDARGPEDRDRLAAAAEAQVSEAEQKRRDATSKRQYAVTKRKEANAAQRSADVIVQHASGVQEALIDAAAKDANKAADGAAEAAATIPKCNALARRTRPDFFDPLATIRPPGSDIFGRSTRGGPKPPGGGHT